MQKILPVLVLAGAAVGGVLYWRAEGGPPHWTGFVEGEERVLRSEVAARVLEVKVAEGDAVEAAAVVVVLDDRDVAARIASKQQELAVAEAEIRTAEERVQLVSGTWTRDLAARRAELRQAGSVADLAERSFSREADLARTGASTAQLLDDARARRDQSKSALDRAREMLARTEAEESNIRLAQNELETLRQRRALIAAQLQELTVQRAKYVIHAPAVATVVQAQMIWPGELAQPGTALLSVIDPRDKYVQIYVPVGALEKLRVGQRVSIELDSRPGERVPGEVSFIADQASFTPEKIETRNDRVGQVYRAKVRILEGVERFQPGTEGNVFLG